MIETKTVEYTTLSVPENIKYWLEDDHNVSYCQMGDTYLIFTDDGNAWIFKLS